MLTNSTSTPVNVKDQLIDALPLTHDDIGIFNAIEVLASMFSLNAHEVIG